MAQQFNLTAQLQLQAPTNANQVINQIRRQLKPIGVQVNIQNAKNLSQANSTLQNFNKNAQASKRSVNELNRTLQESARRFSVITLATGSLLALANGFKNAVKGAVDFEREVIKISQVTGRSITSLQGLTKEITRLSTSFGASSSDLLAVSKILSQAGFAATDTKRALDILAKTTLGSTFDNIQQTTEGAIALLRQFSVEAQRSGGNIAFLEKSLDAVNSVSKNFAVESGDLITAIRRVGGVFSAAGGSVNELIALFTSVRATTRESAETIATGLRTIFTRIQRTETIDQLKRLNIELSDSSGNFVGAYKAVQRLSEGLAGLDPRSGTFSQIVEELGGFRQVGKVIPLIQQFATAQNALNVAQGASGSVTRDAILAQKGLGVQIAKVREQFDALIRKFSDSSTFNTIATGALRLAEAFIKIADSMERLLPLIAGLTFAKLGRGLAPAVGGVLGIGKRATSGGGVSRFASGGLVPGTGNRDTVPAMLTPGEFVIKKSSVKSLGANTLAQMNRNRYNYGGPIKELGGVGKSKFNKKNRKGGDPVQVGLTGDFYYQPKVDDYEVEISRSSWGKLKGKGEGWERWLAKESLKSGKERARGMPRGRLSLQTATSYPIDLFGPAGRLYDAKDFPDRRNIQGKPNKSLNQALVEANIQGYNFTGARKKSGYDYNNQRIGASRTILQPGKDIIDLEPISYIYPKIVAQRDGEKVELSRKEAIEDRKKRTARQKKASGGGVSGSDTVPALLTPGEFVFNKSAAQSIGYSNLNKMNKYGVRGYASGGIVQGFNEGGRAASVGGALEGIRGVAQASQNFIFLAGSASAVATQFLDLEEAQAKTITEMIGFGTVMAGAIGTVVDVVTSIGLLITGNRLVQKSELDEVVANKAATASEYAKVRANKISAGSDVAGGAGGVVAGGAASGVAAQATAGGAGKTKGIFARLGQRFSGLFKPLTKFKVGIAGLAIAVTSLAYIFGKSKYLSSYLQNLSDAAKEAADSLDEGFRSGESSFSGRDKRIEQFRKLQEQEASAAAGSAKLINSAFRLVGGGVGAFAGSFASPILGTTAGAVAGERAGSGAAGFFGYGDKDIEQLERRRSAAIEIEIDAANRLYDAFEGSIEAARDFQTAMDNINRQGLEGSDRTSAEITAFGRGDVSRSLAAQAGAASIEIDRITKLAQGATQEDISAGKVDVQGGQSTITNFNSALELLNESLERSASITDQTIRTFKDAQSQAFERNEFIGASRIRDITSGAAKPTSEYEKALANSITAIRSEIQIKKAKLNLDLIESKAQEAKIRKELASNPEDEYLKTRLKAQSSLTQDLNNSIAMANQQLVGFVQGAINSETARVAEVRSIKAAEQAQLQYAAQTIAMTKTIASFEDGLRAAERQSLTLSNISSARSGSNITGQVVKLTESDIVKINNPRRFASEIAQIVATSSNPAAGQIGRNVLETERIIRQARSTFVGQGFSGTNAESNIKALLSKINISALNLTKEQVDDLVSQLFKAGSDRVGLEEFNAIFANIAKLAQDQINGVLQNISKTNDQYLQNYAKSLDLIKQKQAEEAQARSEFVATINQIQDIRGRITQNLARDRGVEIPNNTGIRAAIREEMAARIDLRRGGVSPQFAGNVDALSTARQSLEARIDQLAKSASAASDPATAKQYQKELFIANTRLAAVNKELERLKTSTTTIDALFEKMSQNSAAIEKERSKRETLLGVLEEAVTGGAEGRQNLYRNQFMATRAIQSGTLQGFNPESQQQILSFLRSLGNEIPIAFGKSGQQLAQELVQRDVARDPFIAPAFKQALMNSITAEEKLILSNQALAVKIDNLAGVMGRAAGVGQGVDPAMRQMIAADPMANPVVRRAMGFAGGGAVYRANGGSIGSIFKPKGTDRIPAMLSEGEYVIQRDAVKQYGTKALDNLNRGKGMVSGPAMSGGGSSKGKSMSQYFETGGVVGALRQYLMDQGLSEIDAGQLVTAITQMSGSQLTTGPGGIRNLLSSKNAEAYLSSDQYKKEKAADELQKIFAETIGTIDITGVTGALNAAVFAARGAAGMTGELNVGDADALRIKAGQQALAAIFAPDFFSSTFAGAAGFTTRGAYKTGRLFELDQAGNFGIEGFEKIVRRGSTSQSAARSATQKTFKEFSENFTPKAGSASGKSSSDQVTNAYIRQFAENQRLVLDDALGASGKVGGFDSASNTLTLSTSLRGKNAETIFAHEKLHSIIEVMRQIRGGGAQITDDTINTISKQFNIPKELIETVAPASLTPRAGLKGFLPSEVVPGDIAKYMPDLFRVFEEEFLIQKALESSGRNLFNAGFTQSPKLEALSNMFSSFYKDGRLITGISGNAADKAAYQMYSKKLSEMLGENVTKIFRSGDSIGEYIAKNKDKLFSARFDKSVQAQTARSLKQNYMNEVVLGEGLGLNSVKSSGLTGEFPVSDSGIASILEYGVSIPKNIVDSDPVLKAVMQHMRRATAAGAYTDEALMASAVQVAKNAMKANPNKSRFGQFLINALSKSKRIPEYLMPAVQKGSEVAGMATGAMVSSSQKMIPVIKKYFPSLLGPLAGATSRVDFLTQEGFTEGSYYGIGPDGKEYEEDPVLSTAKRLLEKAFDQGQALTNLDSNISTFESIASLVGTDGVPVVPGLSDLMSWGKNRADMLYEMQKRGEEQSGVSGDQTGFQKNYDYISNLVDLQTAPTPRSVLQNILDADGEAALGDGFANLYLYRMLEQDRVEKEFLKGLGELSLAEERAMRRKEAADKREFDLAFDFSDTQLKDPESKAAKHYEIYKSMMGNSVIAGDYGNYIDSMYPSPFVLQDWTALKYPMFAITGRGLKSWSNSDFDEFFSEQSIALGGNHKILKDSSTMQKALASDAVKDFLLSKSVTVPSTRLGGQQFFNLRREAINSKAGTVADELYDMYFDTRNPGPDEFDSATSAYNRWDSRKPYSVYNGFSGNFPDRANNQPARYVFHLMDWQGTGEGLEAPNWSQDIKNVAFDRWDTLGIELNNRQFGPKVNRDPRFFQYPLYRAHGGKVPMYMSSGGGVDTVPAMLTAGEYVMRKEAVNRLGVGYLDKLNQGSVPGFAGGGVVDELALGGINPLRISRDRRRGQIAAARVERFNLRRQQIVAPQPPQQQARPKQMIPAQMQQQNQANQAAQGAMQQNIQNLIQASTGLIALFQGNGVFQQALTGITNNHEAILTVSRGISDAAQTLSRSAGNLATAIKEGIKIEMEDVNVNVGGNITLDQNVISGLSQAIGDKIINEAAPAIIEAAKKAIQESGGG